MPSIKVRSRVVQIAVVDIERCVACRLPRTSSRDDRESGIEGAGVFRLCERVASLERKSLRIAAANLNLECVVSRSIVAVDHIHRTSELRIGLEEERAESVCDKRHRTRLRS